MNVLAIETSTDLCSAALQLDARTLVREAEAGQRHSELLLPMVDALLKEGGIALRALDGIAFGAGPGSFTGLRIACGVTQGLAFGANLKVIGISSLLALAAATESDRALCCLDARLGEIFHAAYAREGEAWREISAPVLTTADAAPPVSGSGWHGLGSGFGAHHEGLAQRYARQLAQVNDTVRPHAATIALLGAQAFARGEGGPAATALPLYLRDKVARTIAERAKPA